MAKAEPAPEPAAAFALEDARFAIAGRDLLAPLTASFEPARVTGLIGHNGSGKSTLLKLLSRQQPATSGVVTFGDRPVGAWSGRAFARKVAYLPQHPPTTAGLKTQELVAFGRYPWHGALGRFGAEDAAAVREAMAQADIEAFSDRMVDELSGGERQRVWLAMLVAQQAEWLLLDEPTSALDVAHQMEVLALVRRLSERRGLGVIVVLHDVNMAARYCDELVALNGGRLIARGTPRDVLTAESLQAIYGIGMGVMDHPQNGAPLTYAL